MTDFRTLDDIDAAGKRVLVRLDLNVPMKEGKVTDTTRIDRSVPPLKELIDKGAKVAVMCHLGRPKGKVAPEFSVRPLVEPLSSALGGVPVAFADDCVGPAAAAVIDGLAPGGVALLENLRFHAEEEKNEPDFAKQLAALGDIYVNDAFSAAHRAHASTEGIARLIPAVAGRLMQAELEALSKALVTPDRPVAAVVGGAKVSTKLDVLDNLVEKVNVLVIGGGMANTFLNAKGVNVGKSLCEHEMADTARKILEHAQETGCDILLPTDVVIAGAFEAGAPNQTVPVDQVPDDMMILDVGPETATEVGGRLAACKTILWNGPLGAFEVEPFDNGTNIVARGAARLTQEGKLATVAGGGDTVAALDHAGVKESFSYVSTAGGAFLEVIEGKDLPGVAALRAAK